MTPLVAALSAAVSGFLLGASLIVAIGAQNAFVLRQGLRREFVLRVCLICSLSDALLIAAGVAGVGALVAQSQALLVWVTAAGALFLFAYGVRSFLRALRPEAMQPRGEATKPRRRGRHVPRPHLPQPARLSRHGASDRQPLRPLCWLRRGSPTAVGATAASFVWFFGLGYGAALLTPIFADKRAWRVLDIGVGVVMWGIAARLAPSARSAERPVSGGGELLADRDVRRHALQHVERGMGEPQQRLVHLVFIEHGEAALSGPDLEEGVAALVGHPHHARSCLLTVGRGSTKSRSAPAVSAASSESFPDRSLGR